jgi:hypothetical protein
MNETPDSWNAMLGRLATFVRKHRHCNVPTNDARDPQLGRWVAAQRHRRRIGALSKERIAQLDALDFIWSPTDRTWESMFRALQEFRRKHGHCDVPTKWRQNPTLADWVQRQRLCKKRGRLVGKRMQRLEKLAFSWAIYKGEKSRKTAPPPRAVPDERQEDRVRERLYCIRNANYVQYGGRGKMPSMLESYVKSHDGEFPPYIPLPTRAVLFRLGDGWAKNRTARWKGRGRLPPDVLSHVSEHGTLPPYE